MGVVVKGQLMAPVYTLIPDELRITVTNDWGLVSNYPKGNALITASYEIQFGTREEYLEFIMKTQNDVHPTITVEVL